jgi:hypothetical protein
MERSGYGTRIARKLWGLLGVAACFSMTATPPASAQADAPPPLTVHIDPQTGRILAAPAPGTQPLELSPEIRNSLSTSHEGLKEVPGAEPGGGMKLDLMGRFRSPLLATTDAEGKTKLRHLHVPPELRNKK